MDDVSCGMRGFLVLLLFVGVGCEKSETTGDRNVTAGKVVEVQGSVSATRGDEKRSLAADADVFPDDVIETGAGASIVIRLAHNNVDWSLQDGLAMRVDKSAAWRAPKKQEAPALARDEEDESVAAGRNADKEAGESAATAIANNDPAPKPEPQATATAAKTNKAAKTTKGSRGYRGADKKPVKQRPNPKRAAELGAAGGTRGGGGAAQPPGGPQSTPNDSVVNEKKKIGDEKSAVALIRRSIRACYAKKKLTRKGQVFATAKVADGKIISVSVGPGKDWNVLTSCLKSELVGKKAKTSAKQAVGSVSFK